MDLREAEQVTFLAEDHLPWICSLLGRMPVESQNETPIDWTYLSEPVWQMLVSQAQAEGLAPLIYWNLSRSGKFSSMPGVVRQNLRASYAGTWVVNQALLKELVTLADRFHKADIPLVLLKGACYALTIYPDIGLRPMGDLDILVPASRLAEAVRIAAGLGYREELPEAFPGLNDLLSHHVCLQKSDPPFLSLEIHDRLVAEESFSYAVPVDWFWEQIEPFQATRPGLKLDNLFILSPAAQVLYASAHAMLQHGGKNAPLRWMYDIDRLIRYYESRLDWDLLLHQSREMEWGSALAAALQKTMDIFHTPVPEEVVSNLSASSDRHKKLVTGKQIRPATHSLEEREKLLSLNGYARMRLFLALLIPSPAYMRWRYKLTTSWLLPGYYLFRWWGILVDGLRSLVSLAQ